MTRTAATKPARAPATAHILRKKPAKLHAGGLHSIQDTAIAFGQLKVLPHAASPGQPAQKGQRYTPPSSGYSGQELAPYTGRPGAMDAFDKPSRMGKTLFYRDGHTEDAK